MKIYTLCLLLMAAAFLCSNALAGVEMVTQSTPPPKAVVTTTVSTENCNCSCETPPRPIRFINGIPSNGPVTGDPAYANPECYSAFGFRDYGPARVVPPPPVDTKEMKQPSS